MYNTEDLGNSMMTIRYKVVFVGDIDVGKTSILNRFINNEFSGEYDVKKNILLICKKLFIGNNRCRFCNKDN